MTHRWHDLRNILCIRPDNMGDLLMSAPAITALKKTFGCKITVLTSSMAKGITDHIPAIDDVIVYNVPWVRHAASLSSNSFFEMIERLRSNAFDAAVLFTVFSQNPAPSAMLAYLAGIPKRLAYCRENPYELFTDWIPEEEPYTFLRHQVQRDLDLVGAIGAVTENTTCSILLHEPDWYSAQQKLQAIGMDLSKPWLLLHPGVSEPKRAYPEAYWTELGKKITRDLHYQVLVTGSENENQLTVRIATSIGHDAFAPVLSLGEFIQALAHTPLVISVNTSTVHIAAALQTRIIVLYALTNPQHAPWKATGRIFPFSVPPALQSKNEILGFVNRTLYREHIDLPSPGEIASAARELLHHSTSPQIPELVLPKGDAVVTESATF